ncbi:lipoprotein [Streptomyces sp. NPDC086023]|uniref:lipoprotein n=1 Tax=Streptomyces sp. NPDC086023 TaxID=3365746 RepID=UPI0037D0A366
MAGRAMPGVVPALMACVVLAGCAPDGGKGAAERGAAPPTASVPSADQGAERPRATGTPRPAGSAPGKAAGQVAAKGGTIGAAGSACVLPVTFDFAASWEPAAIEPAPADSVLGKLTRQGPFNTVCEIDAKPAGAIGFLRVYTRDAGAGSPRRALEAFVAGDRNAHGAAYTETATGGLPVAAVTYTVTSELLGESKRESALAVTTPRGAVVLHVGGLDTAEHRRMLPAYELARRSIRPAGGTR